MTDLLKAEFYKLSRSRSFWGITLFSLLLGSVLLLDSIAITDGLVNASLFNTPLLYFLSIVFGSLFVGLTLQSRPCTALSARVISAVLSYLPRQLPIRPPDC